MPDPPSRPPIAPALPEQTNTIAFNFTKKANLLASLRSKHRPSQPQPTTTTTTTAKKGFSSLTTTTTPLPSTPSLAANPHQAQPQTDDVDSAFRAPPNAGIGHAPSSSSTGNNGTTIAQDAETRLLARKILGRNAARQLQEAKDARGGQRGVKRRGGGVADESESEEELGRSAVGRARARGGGGKAGGGDGDCRTGGLKGEEGEDGNEDDVAVAGGKGEGQVVVGDRVEVVESVPRGDDDEKPKKKKRKKTKGAAKGAGGGEEA